MFGLVFEKHNNGMEAKFKKPPEACLVSRGDYPLPKRPVDEVCRATAYKLRTIPSLFRCRTPIRDIFSHPIL